MTNKVVISLNQRAEDECKTFADLKEKVFEDECNDHILVLNNYDNSFSFFLIPFFF